MRNQKHSGICALEQGKFVLCFSLSDCKTYTIEEDLIYGYHKC